MGRRFDPDRAHIFNFQAAMALRSRCGAHLAKLGKENSCTSKFLAVSCLSLHKLSRDPSCLRTIEGESPVLSPTWRSYLPLK